MNDAIRAVAQGIEAGSEFAGVFVARAVDDTPENRRIILHSYDGKAFVVTVEPLALP